MTQRTECRRIMAVFLAAIAVAGVFLVAAGRFAGVEAIWIDETTQISGLGLGFLEQLLWLLHRSDLELGVPLDRMPPLSYWLGGLWASVFGLTEDAMRWFGIVAVLAAAPALYLAGKRAGGRWGGLFCLAFVLLSPNTITQAVEIRAYPLFFAFCAWGAWCFARLMIPEEAPNADEEPGADDAGGNEWREDWPALILLAMFAVVAAYTHFYGLVFAGFTLTALVTDRALRGRALWPALAAATVASFLCLGVAPFVLAAIDAPPSGPTDLSGMLAAHLSDLARGILRLGFRLAGHGSHLVHPAALGLLVAGALGLALMILTGLTGQGGSNRGRASGHAPVFWTRVALLAPVLIAVPVLAALDAAIGKFRVLEPHYNLWMIPLAAVWLSTALRAGEMGRATGWRAPVPALAAVLAVAGHLLADANLLRHPRHFTHGPGEWVAGMISDPRRTLVVHDGAADQARPLWAHVYLPVHFLTGGEVTQIAVGPDGEALRLTQAGTRPIGMKREAFLARFDTILRVSTRNRNGGGIAEAIRKGAPCGGGTPPSYGGGENDFQSEPPVFHCAFASATLVRSTRRAE